MVLWAGIMSDRRTALVCSQGTVRGERYVQEILLLTVFLGPSSLATGSSSYVTTHDLTPPEWPLLP